MEGVGKSEWALCLSEARMNCLFAHFTRSRFLLLLPSKPLTSASAIETKLTNHTRVTAQNHQLCIGLPSSVLELYTLSLRIAILLLCAPFTVQIPVCYILK